MVVRPVRRLEGEGIRREGPRPSRFRVSSLIISLLLRCYVAANLASRHNITDTNSVVADGTIFWSPVHNELRTPAVQL